PWRDENVSGGNAPAVIRRNSLTQWLLAEGIRPVNTRSVRRLMQDLIQEVGRKHDSMFIDIAAHEVEHRVSLAAQFVVKHVQGIFRAGHAVRDGREVHVRSLAEPRTPAYAIRRCSKSSFKSTGPIWIPPASSFSRTSFDMWSRPKPRCTGRTAS